MVAAFTLRKNSLAVCGISATITAKTVGKSKVKRFQVSSLAALSSHLVRGSNWYLDFAREYSRKSKKIQHAFKHKGYKQAIWKSKTTYVYLRQKHVS